MPKVLLYIPMEAQVRAYQTALAAGAPDLDLVATADAARAEQELAAGAEILVGFAAAMRPAFFRQAPKLRWVHALGTGVDGVIDQPLIGDDVVITATRGIHGAPLSEAAFGFMLALARDLKRSLRAQAEKKWERWPSRLLAGKTVGILGMGAIAAELAPRCKAFGMTVVGMTRKPRPAEHFDRVVARDDLIAVAPTLDFLVLLLPYDDSSHHIVNAEVLAAMKKTAFLVNIARGGVIDDAALIAVLEAGGIAGAGLDAFAEEPLPPDSPLWTAPNLLITAHMAGMNERYVADAIPQFLDNLARFRRGALAEMINRER